MIATKAHRDGLAQRFQARGLDTTRAIEQGRYIALDAAETLAKFMVDGWPTMHFLPKSSEASWDRP